MLKAFIDKPLKVRVIRGLLLALFVSFGAWCTPTPYHLEAPGRALHVSSMITIESEQLYPSKGEFLLPTVVSERANLLYCLYGFFDPEADLHLESSTGPMAQSHTHNGGHQMAMSQYFSALVAFREAGYDVSAELTGLRVLRVVPESPNLNVLEEQDLLVEVDGIKLTSFGQFKQILNEKKTGVNFPAKVLRNNEEQSLELQVFRPEKRALIGVSLRPELVHKEFPLPIAFANGNASGASGGLVFALEIYDKLTPEDLTRGRKIAATGTLSTRGEVGAIRGINFKLKGAQRAGADVVLIPADNQTDVSWIPDGVEVIPVSSFNEAVDVLKR